MELRDATSEDIEDIRSLAQRSLTASYSHFLDEEAIDTAVEEWYGDAEATTIESEDYLFLVAESEGEIAGFSQSEFLGESHGVGQILWIHVDPDHRGKGTAARLLARTREELIEAGADHIRATVLEENESGNEFYVGHGFEKAGTKSVNIGSNTHTENVYVESEFEADEEWRAIEETTIDDETLYVSYGEPARGSQAPFYSLYQDEGGDERYGWLCGNCDSFDNAMDAMGRIECNVCGNRRKATRWDASYL